MKVDNNIVNLPKDRLLKKLSFSNLPTLFNNEDTKIDDYSFIRTINNQTFIINHGKVTYYSIIKYIIKSISIFYKGKYIINYILNIIGYILFEIILTLFLIFNCLIYLAVIQTIILFIIDLLS